MTDEADIVDGIVAQTKQHRPDLDATAVELLSRSTRLGRLVELRTRRSLEPFGLGIGAFWLLVALRRSGPPFELTPSGIIANVTVTPGAVSQQLDRLEQRGLVLREAHPADGRGVLVRLTDAGLTLVEAAWTAHINADRSIFDGLDYEEKRALIALLRVVERDSNED